MSGRITYNNIIVDIEKFWSQFDYNNISRNATTSGISGVEEIAHFFDQDFVTAGRERISPQEVVELEGFYAYARDGSSFQFEKDRNVGTFISFDKKSTSTNDGTAATFTRTGAAYTLDPYTGLLTSVAANTPRFVAGKYGAAVQIDGARTNLITHPSDLNGTGWAQVGTSTVTTDTTETKDPAGNNNASKVVGTGIHDNRWQSATAIGTNDGTCEVWLKSQNSELTLTMQFSNAGGSIQTENVAVTPEWQKFKVVHESSGSESGNAKFVIGKVSSGTYYVYGCGLYVGADVLFPTTIPDPISTSSTTRNDELLLIPSANIINQKTGTIMFWFKPRWEYNKHSSAMLFISGASVGTPHIAILVTPVGNLQVIIYRDNSGTGEVNYFTSASSLVQNNWHFLVVTYDTTIPNSSNLYLDGALIATSSNTSGFNVSDVGTNFAIGSTLNGAQPAFCAFDDFYISKRVWSAAEIREVANRGEGLGLGKNRWTSMLLANPNFNPVWNVGNDYNVTLRLKEKLS